jgi:hypothetical protein
MFYVTQHIETVVVKSAIGMHAGLFEYANGCPISA